MNRPIHSKTFKSGNSEAVRLPKGLGFGIGADIVMERRGNELVLRAARDPDEAKQRWLAALDALKELPKPPAIQKRERFEFPDRPGL